MIAGRPIWATFHRGRSRRSASMPPRRTESTRTVTWWAVYHFGRWIVGGRAGLEHVVELGDPALELTGSAFSCASANPTAISTAAANSPATSNLSRIGAKD